ILPSNGRRLVRALEVIRITGRPFSAALPRRGPARYGMLQIGLDRVPAVVDTQIELRVERMFAAGLVDEVRGLLPGLRAGRTASRALGYQQILAALDAGTDPAEAVAPTVLATRRFVRRQRSWFRRDDRIHWLDADRPDLIAAALSVAGYR
ncbi:MAG TPA: tRNA dimethylallyltransferase, partial [Pseudonocardiaceae bacterium]|nr:tRNA dimethylallyltransferase [Pseudonocardiaceae bacterium]